MPTILVGRPTGKIGQSEHRDGAEDSEPFRGETVRVNIAEGPPVPIPNTEVKLCYADNTCRATYREDRSMRTQAEPGNEAQPLNIPP